MPKIDISFSFPRWRPVFTDALPKAFFAIEAKINRQKTNRPVLNLTKIFRSRIELSTPLFLTFCSFSYKINASLDWARERTIHFYFHDSKSALIFYLELLLSLYLCFVLSKEGFLLKYYYAVAIHLSFIQIYIFEVVLHL